MFDPPEPWFLSCLIISLLAFLVLLTGHVKATNSRRLASEQSQGAGKSKDHHLRFTEELLRARLLQARLAMLNQMHSVLIHFSFLFNLTVIWKCIYEPGFASFCQLFATGSCYVMFLITHKLVKTEAQFRWYELFYLGLHVLFMIEILEETDLMMFDVAERLCTAGTICTCMTLIDLELTLPFYFCQSAFLTYCRWKLMGFATITPALACASILPNIIVGGVITLCVKLIQSNIEAKLDSGDSASLMMGFRQILRGVCDGDFILDRKTMTIVDDASCLERILKSNRKLVNCNFLDLFLNSESRENFSQFLAAEDPSAEYSMPRGWRASLQGARGPVSVDLFYTALPGPGPSRDYYLLAMKEDPEQAVLPEAPPNSVPQIGALPTSASQSRSAASDIVVACDDLVEVAMLVSDATGLLDVEQVHLSFQRKSDVSNIESGMPTLRRFIRPSDWDRIEHMFNIVINLPAESRLQRCYFQRPTLFRVPGESRSYLCARSTSLRLADEDVTPGRATHFWMHLTNFDFSQLIRPPEQELDRIEEDRIEEDHIEEEHVE